MKNENQKPIVEGKQEEGMTINRAVYDDATNFQLRVDAWLMACFGIEIARDKQERNHRFIEEALELVQSCGATESECQQLVQYVYGRPSGEMNQECGGVMVTLAALCLAQNLNMMEAGETELKRIWTKVEQIREKQANKPKHSPLPTPPGTLQEAAKEYANTFLTDYDDEKVVARTPLDIRGYCETSFLSGASWQANQSSSDAVEFAEWMFSNGYKKYGNKEDWYFNENPTPGKQTYFTLTELYELFRKQKH